MLQVGINVFYAGPLMKYPIYLLKTIGDVLIAVYSGKLMLPQKLVYKFFQIIQMF